MSLALFDLDDTLLCGDSNRLWMSFLARRGHVDGAWQESERARFEMDYLRGQLDIQEYLRFSLAPLRHIPVELLCRLQEQFVRSEILPRIPAAARRLLAQHRSRGHTLLIISCTPDVVSGPIAAELGVDALIATRAASTGGRFCGEVAGTPCFREGKVERLEAWLKTHDAALAGSWFYSDSHNDLALLERVAHPVAVNPDTRLLAVARRRGWPVRYLRCSPEPGPDGVAA